MSAISNEPDRHRNLFHRCEIHHNLLWEHDWPTGLHNLIPICSRHHHLIHESAWQLALADDRTLTIRQPDGEVFNRSRPDITQQHTKHRKTAA